MSEPRVGPRQRMRIPETVHARAFDDEVIILDLGGGDYFSLDPVGSLAWNKFAAGGCVEEIAAEIAAEYDVDADRALKDLVALASELVSRGLLVPEV